MRLSISCLLLLACSGEEREEARIAKEKLDVYEAPSPLSRREQREREGRDRHAIDLYVDGIAVATIGEHQFAEWPRIDLQLPPDATLDHWKTIRIETDGDPVVIERPTTRYPGAVPLIFPGRGRAGSLGMFDPRALQQRANPSVRVDAVREVRIELAADGRSDRERAFARACTEVKRGEEKPPPGNGHFMGTAYQHNIDEYWTVDMTIDLSESKVGDKVGSVTYHGHKCRGNLFRLPDVNGRRRVVERFWHNENGICVEACILELQCDGTSLDYRGLYPDGSFVAHARLLRVK